MREDVYVEPLVNNWYAWPYLIPPATYACYLKRTHLRLMKSFLKNRELHQLGIAIDGLAGGGAVVDCSDDQVAAMENLVNTIESECRGLLDLENAIAGLNDKLEQHERGFSLEYLYAEIPDALRGYVELVSDLNHNPKFRLIEPLLYRSRFYRDDVQSFSFGLLSKVERRPFVLSTPRLPDEKHLHVHCPFNDDALDEILASRQTPISKEKIESFFASRVIEGGPKPMDFFTQDPPKPRLPALSGGQVKMAYLGHAGMWVQSDEINILIDPVIPCRGSDYAESVISYSELPEVIDYVLLTHSHADHVNLETLIQLRHKITNVLVPKNNGGMLCDPSLKFILGTLGFNVTEVDEMETIEAQHCEIRSIPFLGEHGDLDIRSKTAWFINMHGKRIYIGADSSNLETRMYELIHKETGDLDVMAIGMECVGAPYTWLYGALTYTSLSFDQKASRRLNGSNAETVVHMINTFNPAQVCIYALGMEPWFQYFMGLDYSDDSEQIVESGKVIQYCHDNDIPVERLYGKMERILG